MILRSVDDSPFGCRPDPNDSSVLSASEYCYKLDVAARLAAAPRHRPGLTPINYINLH